MVLRRPRDSQRSRVYAWQRTLNGYDCPPEWKTIQEVSAWAEPVWRTERGRYGLARKEAPEFVAAGWGQRRALSYRSHKISLPLWARKRSVVLHEMAHRLAPTGEAHGPRFVAILMGLLARHAGFNLQDMMEKADQQGVKYHARSVGTVPLQSLTEQLWALLPISEMDAACELDVSWRQVRGASIRLLTHKRARWLRGKLVRLTTT